MRKGTIAGNVKEAVGIDKEHTHLHADEDTLTVDGDRQGDLSGYSNVVVTGNVIGDVDAGGDGKR